MADEVTAGPDQALPVVQGNTLLLSVASHPAVTGKKSGGSTAMADDEVTPTDVYILAASHATVTGKKGAKG